MTFFVDGQNVGTIAGQFADASHVQVEGYAGGTTTFYVDDIRARKWSNSTPTIAVGIEENR